MDDDRKYRHRATWTRTAAPRRAAGLRGRALRALRARVDAAPTSRRPSSSPAAPAVRSGGPGRHPLGLDVRAVRSGPARLPPVRALRHLRSLRVHEANPRPHRGQERAQRLPVLRAREVLRPRRNEGLEHPGGRARRVRPALQESRKASAFSTPRRILERREGVAPPLRHEARSPHALFEGPASASGA